MTMDTKIRLMVVDDHPIVTEGVKIMVFGTGDIEFIGSACDGKELFAFLQRDIPDVLLLDLGLSGQSGIEITRELMVVYPGIRVIIFSADTEEATVVSALEAGARGYLSKDVGRDELIKGIRAVADGQEFLGGLISRKVIHSYLRFMKSTGVESRRLHPELSDREKEVVGLIAEGFTYKEIGERLFISARTVEAHRNNIMSKLELKTVADLIKYSIRQGITKL